MEELPVSTVVAALGFVLGLIFGATAQRTNFCTMGAIQLRFCTISGNWESGKKTPLKKNIGVMNSVKRWLKV